MYVYVAALVGMATRVVELDTVQNYIYQNQAIQQFISSPDTNHHHEEQFSR